MIPVISLYLIFLKNPELPLGRRIFWKPGLVWMLGGILLLAVHLWVKLHDGSRHPENYLACATASFLLFLVGGCVMFLGSAACRQISFPLAFLSFMAPIPFAIFDAITRFFQETSAATTEGFLIAAGMPVIRDGMSFHMPGFSLLVIPECAGMHSTLVFFISLLLTSYLFLQTGWKRALLVALAIPLAILRNAFRIFVISEMCVRISPDMIHSFIHSHGGPIFFALSYIPVIFVLKALKKSEVPDARVRETGP